MSLISYYGHGSTKDTGNITESAYVPQSKQYKSSTGELLLTYGGGSMVIKEKREVITSTSKPPNNRQASNYCVHSRTQTRYQGDVNSKQITHQTVGGGNDSDYHDYSVHTVSRSNHTSAFANALSTYPIGTNYLDQHGQEFIDEAIVDLKPDLTVASVPNMILELGDVKRMFDLWNRNVSLARNAAGGHLNVQFGWKPFIGDLKSVVGALSKTRERIRAFQAQLGKISHRSKLVFEENIPLNGSSVASEVKVSYTGTLRRRVTAHAVYRANRMPDLSAEEEYVRGLLDSLGFELNPAIVWNAIPFSFVADWVFDVGNYLEAFKVDTLELPISYVDTYLQYTEDIWFESNTQTVFGRSDFAPWPRSGGWTFNSRFFHRLPIRPNPPILRSVGWKTPTVGQAILGLSLAIVNR